MDPTSLTAVLALAAALPVAPGSECEPPRIESVELVRQDVFAEDESGSLYGLVNKAHVVTRASVIRRDVLFAEGDPLDVAAIEQTERNLRERAYLREVSIEVLDGEGRVLGAAGEPGLAELPCRTGLPGTVLVRITTRDAWSTSVEGTLKRSGDRSLWSVGIGESNFLGHGKQVELAHAVDLDRTSDILAYRDPNVIGGPLQLHVGYASQSDGARFILELGHPFRELDTPWGWALRSEAFDQIQPIYLHGDRDRELRHVRRRHELELTRLVSRSGSRAIRVHAGYRAWHDEVDGTGRDFGIFNVAVSRVEHRYRELTHVTHERPEDLNLGAETRVGLGYSAPGPWASDRALFLEARHTQGFAVGDRGVLMTGVTWTGRVRGGGLENGLGDARLTFLGLVAPRRTLLLSARLRGGTRLDPERQLTLGAQNGLRGYPVHEFSGDRTLLLTAEHRWFVADDVLRILSVGITTFADAGFAWRGRPGASTDGLRTNVGFGLLLGRKRLSMRNAAVRVDLAYALRPVEGRGRWLLSFSPAVLDF